MFKAPQIKESWYGETEGDGSPEELPWGSRKKRESGRWWGVIKSLTMGLWGLESFRIVPAVLLNLLSYLNLFDYFKAAGFTYGLNIIAKELVIHRRPNCIACDV